MFKKWLICTFLIIYSFTFGYSEQVVVSQFDIGLKNSSSNNNYKYSLTGVTKSGDIKAVTSTDLSTVIDFNGATGGSFTEAADNLKFNYSTAEKSVIIPLNKNSSATVATGAFQLTETTSVSGESALTYLIQDSIILPAKSIALSQDTNVSTGIKFTYNDSAKAAHLSAYKMQKFMVRIAKSSITDTNYDIVGKKNGMQLANNIDTSNSTSYAESFLDGNTEYVDFLVTADQYDKAQSISTNVGLSLKFMPEDIEVFGLPKGSYRIELYSFRYSKEVTTKGNVVITKEDNKTFSIGETEFLEEGIDIISFSSAEFDTIKATILTIGNTTSSSITVSEDGSPMIGTITATSGSIYVDSTSSGALLVTTGGTLYNSQYYQLWSVVYKATNKTINTDTRIVKYTAGSKDISTTYNVISSTPQFTSEPLYQTVFAGFKDTTFSVGTFEIDDRTVNKYSDGYRNVRVANVPLITTTSSSSIDIQTLYKGTTGTDMENSSYNWLGSTVGNSLVISKVKSDSKGTFRNINDITENFTFYTTEWNPKVKYEGEGNTANFVWESPSNSSYNTTVIQDKMIFRLIKMSTGEVEATVNNEYYYNPSNNSKPILTGETNLGDFISGSAKYTDLIFETGTSSSVTKGDAYFAYSSSNKLLVSNLPRGDYLLQIYSLQGEDVNSQNKDCTYRVLTYGEYKKFTLDIPTIATGTYKNKNNLYVINSKTVEPSLDNLDNPVKDVTVKFTTKTQKKIGLDKDTNLRPLKLEESEVDKQKNTPQIGLNIDTRVTEQKVSIDSITKAISDVGEIKAVTNLKLEAGSSDFKYPLDIVLCVDTSGSMQVVINKIKTELSGFTSKLEARGYDVKYNLISFGYNAGKSYKASDDYILDNLHGDTYYMKQFKKDGKWFSDISELTVALNGLTINGAMWSGQENGAWAIDRSINYLKNYGRYLDKNNGPVTHDQYQQGFVSSEKMIIFFTDENMDTDDLPSGYANSGSVIKDISTKLNENDIKLTGIFHTGALTRDVNKYKDKGLSYVENDFYSVAHDKGKGWLVPHLNKEQWRVYVEKKGPVSLFNGYMALKKSGSNPTYTYGADAYKATIVGTPQHYNMNLDLTQKYVFGQTDTSFGSVKEYSILKETGVYKRIKDKLGIEGIYPEEPEDAFYVDFALPENGLGDNFSMYEMGLRAENVSTALTHSVSNVSILQNWKMTYTSPFNNSDGDYREIIFSLDTSNILVDTYDSATKTIIQSPLVMTPAINRNDRIYNVPEVRIEAYFINPDSTKKQLEKKDGQIILTAKARSQYRNKEGTLSNYPITKGTFIITGDYSNDGISKGDPKIHIVTSDDINAEKVTLTDIKEEGSTWYYGESNLDAKKFTKKFGKNPMNVVVKFIAETAEESKTITLSGVKVIDKIAPKITAITMTNITLANLMRELKSDSVTRAFTDEAVTSAAVRVQNQTEAENTTGTGIVALSTDSALNVKAGDSVEIGVVIDDENVTDTSGTVQIGYGNDVDNFTTATCVSVNITSDSAISTWKATIPIVNSATAQDEIVKNITYKVIDGSSSPNTRIVSGNAFNQPTLLDNVSLEPNSSNPAGSEYSNYYTLTANQISSNDKTNGALVNIKNEVANTLGYIVVFNYNTANIDTGDPTKTYGNHSTNANLKYEAIGNSDFPTIMDGKFRFGAGEYTYNGTVYVINSAGAIKSITSSTVNSLDNIINVIGVGTARFYVDTIAPVVKSIQLEKTADVNSELNSPSLPETNSLYNIIHGIIGETVTVTGGTDYKRPFKAGDNLSLIGTIIEKNIAKSLIGGENIFTDNNLGIITGTESYSKTGIAKDLGEQINQLRDVIIYDKAGNKAIYLTDKTTSELTTNKIQLEIVYDDRTPNNLETKASIVNGVDIVGSVDEVSTKFTKEPTLPLTSTENGVPLSLVIVDSNIYGDVRKGTGTLGSFGYSITTDKLYEPIITTYSYSGIKGETVEDRIILDTVVGSLDSSVNLKSTVANITVANLNDIFNGIFEMVGLSKYSIDTNSTEVSGIQLGGVDYTKGTLRVLTGAPYYQVASKPNPANIIGGSNFTFNVPSGGSYTFIITVYDRLGNFKNISYSVEIPNNVNIIGKKSGISKVISTKVNNSTKKMKIQSRAE